MNRRLWRIPIGVLLGGCLGFAIAFFLVVFVASGSGGAQGIADWDPTPGIVMLVGLGGLIGGFIGLASWLKGPGDQRKKEFGPSDELL